MTRGNTVILRYKGGAGGEAFYRWLDACMAGIVIDPIAGGSGIRNVGPIGGLLQTEWTGAAARHAGIANSRWTDLTPSQVRSVITGEIRPLAGRDAVLLHGHYVMDGSMLREAFPEAFIIDLMPSGEDVWLCHTLQMAKEMARKVSDVPPWVLDLPGAEIITGCMERNGWFPAFWVRMVSDGVDVRDIPHLFRHISRDEKNTDDGSTWLHGGDSLIDARSWLLGNGDSHLGVLDRLCLETSTQREHWVSSWKLGNAMLLLELGCDGMITRGGDQGEVVSDLMGPLLEDLNRLAL